LRTGPVAGVYLTGWEYNRFLSKDGPTRPRNSALPAAILWKGAHQLWMFEHIYVTREASANEQHATEELGWIMGDVLTWMSEEDALRLVDWSGLNCRVRKRMAAVREHELESLKRKLATAGGRPEVEDMSCEEVAHEVVVGAIRAGRHGELERLKLLLLDPVLEDLGCVASGAPTNLETWVPASRSEPMAATLEAELQRCVAHPVIPGLVACRSPATMGSAFKDQQRVTAEVEAPLIVDLIAGLGEFADPNAGFKPYIEALKPHRAAYEGVNRQMREQWLANRDRLRRLRDVAREHLWPRLHQEWLPCARAGDAKFVRKQLPRLVTGALTVSPFVELLDNTAIKMAVGFAGRAALLTSTHLAAENLGVSTALTEAAALTGTEALARKLGPYWNQAADLGVFYHQARAS
jgi:hypothetical protein